MGSFMQGFRKFDVLWYPACSCVFHAAEQLRASRISMKSSLILKPLSPIDPKAFKL